jgi:meso-butanediol dehydrogenase/(S,S)-butanediol dehydrogenase/diacetyl reductase
MRLHGKIALSTGRFWHWRSHRQNLIPTGRYGESQEIANVALFPASDEASSVTVACVVANGGLWAHSGMPSLSGQGPAW